MQKYIENKQRTPISSTGQEEITRIIRKHSEIKGNKTATCQTLRDVDKAVHRSYLFSDHRF